MHILIAPNAFKNSLTAQKAAAAIEKGLLQSRLPCTCECFPIADGGDGTGELIMEKLGGTIIEATVTGPLGRACKASFGLIEKEQTAVIEMAAASGLHLLKQEELNPLHALSTGTGEMIRLALDKGARKIILGVGGSATVDGGVGILRVLGVRFFDAADQELTGMPQSLIYLKRVDLSGLDTRMANCEIKMLCDVENHLLGSLGAASVFGPQKGAGAEEVIKLEAALQQLSHVVLQQYGKDMTAVTHGGAAGGTAAGLFALLNAKLCNGAEEFLTLTGFEEQLKRADLVITGEGSLDEQTMQGKGPFAVAVWAKRKLIRVIGLAGRVPLQTGNTMSQYFDVLMAIGEGPSDLFTALQHTEGNLIRSAEQLGNLLAISTAPGLEHSNGE
ncbi:MAG: glycerate kinase [Sediminibacterium sp.]